LEKNAAGVCTISKLFPHYLTESPANKYYDPVEAIQRIPEGIYLHAGAARYYQEVAYVPDYLIPPDMN